MTQHHPGTVHATSCQSAEGSRHSPSGERLPLLTEADRLHAALDAALAATSHHQGNCG